MAAQDPTVHDVAHADPDEKAVRCIRCGFCLDACPTFRLTGNEAASPRGRIYLMRSVSEGVLPIKDGVLQYLDSCLGCRACETACPSGVEYASILEHYRARIEQSDARPSVQRWARNQLLNTLTSPRRLRLLLTMGRAFSGLLGRSGTLPRPLAGLLTGDPRSRITLPAMSTRGRPRLLPERHAALGSRRATVAVLEGCVMRVLYAGINEATVRVLQQNGCEVLTPRGAGCCGALDAHAGRLEQARAHARALIDALEPLDFDALVINSAGCGSTVKEYGELLADDPAYSRRAAALAAKTRDISEFLVERGLEAPTGRLEVTVAYHDACHLAHGQKITAQPRALLRAIPGLRLVELPESDTCCGSAGIYNLTQPNMARRLLDRKCERILATGAAVVATANPGCLAWIEQGMRERGATVRVLHPVELLDAAYRQVPL